MKKQILCLLLAAGLAWGSLITAEAAETRIEQVAVEITCSPVPAAGDEPGSVTASTTGTEFTIESAEYTNDTDIWVLGDEPVVMVELYAKDGYRFSYQKPLYHHRRRSRVQKGQAL